MAMMNNSGGKGGASRPLSVSLDEFGDKFVGIFGERKRTNGGWTPPPLNTSEQSPIEKGDVKTLVTIDSLVEHTGETTY